MQQDQHRAYCALAVKWLQRPRSAGGPGCAVAVMESSTGWNGERPDAIGFRFTGHAPTDGSVVVEVKVSRSDFLADARKPHRQEGGCGSWRYFMAPTGLISPEELPAGWGLLEVTKAGHIKPVAGHALYFRQSRHDEYLQQAAAWRFPAVDHDREKYLLTRLLANTDPQKALDMVREANNRNAQLLRRIDAIGAALGLPKGSSTHEVERAARNAANYRVRRKQEDPLQPIARALRPQA